MIRLLIVVLIFVSVKVLGTPPAFSKNIDSTKSQVAILNFKDSVFQLGETYTYHELLWNWNSWDLTDYAKIELTDLVQFLKTNIAIHIEIGVHYDAQQAKAMEKRSSNLSSKRAKSIKSFLVNSGISNERMTSVGYGYSQPLIIEKEVDSLGNTPPPYSINKRTEIKITSTFKEYPFNLNSPWAYDSENDTVIQIHKINTLTFSPAEAIQLLNMDYGNKFKIEFVKQNNDTVFVKIPESRMLTQGVGSTETQEFIISATFTLTEADGINYVYYDFEPGDNLVPGVYFREYYIKQIIENKKMNKGK